MARKAKQVRKTNIQRASDQVSAEVALASESGSSMFETSAVLTANNLDRYKPPGGRGTETARVLQELGFKVRHIGTFSISVEASRSLWEKSFNTKVTKRTQPISTTHPEIGSVEYWSHVADTNFADPAHAPGPSRSRLSPAPAVYLRVVAAPAGRLPPFGGPCRCWDGAARPRGAPLRRHRPRRAGRDGGHGLL